MFAHAMEASAEDANLLAGDANLSADAMDASAEDATMSAGDKTLISR